MSERIADGTRTGHAAWSKEYAIGFVNCYACKAETPEPPQSVIDSFAARQSSVSTIWPFEHWPVPGWIDMPEFGKICDRCARAVMALLGNRRKGADAPTASDAALLEGYASHALQLANEGLLTAFPPLPRLGEKRYDDSYPYKHPTKSYAWRNRLEYDAGMMRDRIREIRNALQGRPLEDE